MISTVKVKEYVVPCRYPNWQIPSRWAGCIICPVSVRKSILGCIISPVNIKDYTVDEHTNWQYHEISWTSTSVDERTHYYTLEDMTLEDIQTVAFHSQTKAVRSMRTHASVTLKSTTCCRRSQPKQRAMRDQGEVAAVAVAAAVEIGSGIPPVAAATDDTTKSDRGSTLGALRTKKIN